jgi:RHS repeat-associated protein
MDNIVSKVTEHGEYAYGYDDLYRLTTADNPVQDDEEFTYDPVGNRLTSSDTTGLWTYNDNNELNAHNDTSYEYDDNGNLTNKTVGSAITSYGYNIEDRLSEVWNGEPKTGTLIASYYYDPFGRRLWKDVGGTRTYFLYADEGLIGEYDSTGTEIKTYGYKPGSTWTTDPIFMKQDGNYYFYQNDHLGTPQMMTGVNGSVVWAAKHNSFGEASVDASFTIINNLRLAGQYFDQQTRLHYNYFRYYDARTGRYLSTDPIGLAGGINLHTYCFNNPLNWMDSFGLSSLVFDPSAGTLTLISGSGEQIGSWDAGNEVVTGTQPWPAGTHAFSWHNPHPESGPNDNFGSYGNFIFDVPGRTGMGVHSGRANDRGVNHPTNGCIRTTDQATSTIWNTHYGGDPLTQMEVIEGGDDDQAGDTDPCEQ